MEENEAIKFMQRYTDADCYTDKCVSAHKIAIKALEEVQQYRAIGTPKECRTAVEKRVAKKVVNKEKAVAPEDAEAYGADALFGECPACGFTQNNVWNNTYCGDCGQALDWSDE